jgi:hypothetical protein
MAKPDVLKTLAAAAVRTAYDAQRARDPDGREQYQRIAATQKALSPQGSGLPNENILRGHWERWLED